MGDFWLREIMLVPAGGLDVLVVQKRVTAVVALVARPIGGAR